MTTKKARPLRRWSLLVASALALGAILGHVAANV